MKHTHSSEAFRVEATKPCKLKKIPTRLDPLFESATDYSEQLAQYRRQINEHQSVLYAEQKRALLLIFQGMDTAGKGGTIRHVMSGINPQGCQVHSFGKPSEEELAHDYLWRCVNRLPRRGMIGIFDRSYYEEVLVVRVKPEVLAGQSLPAELVQRKHFWQERYADIRQFEDYLGRNGTTIIKFFLHLSPEEQRSRLLARIDDPQKNWKFRLGDLDCRRHWQDFQKAYQDCLRHTTSPNAPWYVIPADDKKNARLLVSQIIVKTLEKMDLQYPVASAEHLAELQIARQALESVGDLISESPSNLARLR